MSRTLICAQHRQLSCALFVMTACMSASVSAQHTRRDSELRGVVIDTTGRKLADAQVNLLGTALATTTDSGGRFAIANVPAGVYAVLTRRNGFEQLVVDATVSDSGSVDLLIRLVPQVSNAQLLDTVVTRATAPARPALADAERRRNLGVGYFITQETIAKHTEWPMTSLLRATTTGITYVRHCSRGFAAAGTGDGSISLRPVRQPGCIMPAACYMQVFLDGVRMYAYDGSSVPPSLDDFRLHEVEALEVYRGAETPAQYRSTGSVCGTILIWLRH